MTSMGDEDDSDSFPTEADAGSPNFLHNKVIKKK